MKLCLFDPRKGHKKSLFKLITKEIWEWTLELRTLEVVCRCANRVLMSIVLFSNMNTCRSCLAETICYVLIF